MIKYWLKGKQIKTIRRSTDGLHQGSWRMSGECERYDMIYYDKRYLENEKITWKSLTKLQMTVKHWPDKMWLKSAVLNAGNVKVSNLEIQLGHCKVKLDKYSWGQVQKRSSLFLFKYYLLTTNAYK